LNSRRPLRIGVDAHTIDGIHQGTRTHCIELFSRVVQRAPEIEFFFFLSEPNKLLEVNEAFSAPNVTAVPMRHRSPPLRLLFQLPVMARRLHLDLLHCQYIVPPFSPCPTAVTIHDTLFESNPEFFSKFFVIRSRLLMRRSALRSSLVFSVSEFSRRELIQRYELREDQVITVPNGADCKRFHPAGQPNAELGKYGIESGAYLLTVGRLEPRKNHIRLVKAYQALPRPRPKLVIIGQRDFGYSDVFDTIRAADLTDEILVLENVNDRMLPMFYQNALAFVYPSLAEGFGMPLLEAMASGIPVITSGNTALREVGGDAVLFVHPDDPASIASAISVALADAELRRDLVERGLRRVSRYNWDNSAADVVSSYRQLLTNQE
jgi:glycosyltransferase involved in cell wall biosynthesis